MVFEACNNRPDSSASFAANKNSALEYGIYSTKVKDNKGRVWDLGKREHLPDEEQVWIVNACTERIDKLAVTAFDERAEHHEVQPINSLDSLSDIARLAA